MERISVEQLTLFAEDSPAKIFPPLEKAQAFTANAQAFGLKCSASSEDPDPLFASLKTLLHSESGGAMWSSKGWKKRATPLGRLWWALDLPELPIGAAESGWLPTPTATDSKERAYQVANGIRYQTLVGYARDWIPTPVASDTGSRKHRYSQGGLALSGWAGGQLNPFWVEWVMGFPIGHTELKPSEIPSSQP
jgi:hypothetical protein